MKLISKQDIICRQRNNKKLSYKKLLPNNNQVRTIIALTFFLFQACICTIDVHAAVEPINYDFSLDELGKFALGKKVDEIDKKYKAEIMNEDRELTILKYDIEHLRYKFPIFVHVYQNTIIDTFARLPSYFLHDVFHQSLINRLGKQDVYKKHEESASYIWENNNGVKHIYHGACTITCFPIYYAQIPAQKPQNIKNYKPLIEKMLDDSPK